MRARELSRKGNYYAGGWNPAKKRVMDAIKLPDQLGCNVCGQLHALWRYSEKNQRDLRNAIACRHVDPNKLDEEAWLKCSNCTSKQNTEMECCICEVYKGLDGFTKAQRRTPDTARCIECVSDHLKDSPDDEIDVNDNEDDTASVSNAHENSEFGDSESGGGVGLSTQSNLSELNVAKLSISSGVGKSKASTSVQSSKTSTGRARSRVPSAAVGGWQDMSRSRGGCPKQGAQFTGYDPQGTRHDIIRSPSTVAGNDDSDDDSDDIDSEGTVKDTAKEVRTTARDTRSERHALESRSNFTKSAALGIRKQPVKPEKYAGRTVAKYDDDSDDEEDFYTI